MRRRRIVQASIRARTNCSCPPLRNCHVLGVEPRYEFPPRLDAERLLCGVFECSSRDLGDSLLTVGRDEDGNFLFAADFPSIGQRWQSLATPAFAPTAATLTLERAATTTGFQLYYAEGRVTGTATVPRAGHVSGDSDDVVIREVTHSLPKGVVDQRIDWAAVLAGPVEANDVFAFPVFDPGTGISEVRARVLTSET
jgi:hypothetical protein